MHPYDVSAENILKSASLVLTGSKEGLRQAPKANQPFIPDTAPVRRSHVHANESPQPSPMQQDSATPSANPNSTQVNMDIWEGTEQRQVPMSTREVATPGNRPGLFPSLHDRGKTAKQPDFHHPYFPLRFIEVPKCKLVIDVCYIDVADYRG